MPPSHEHDEHCCGFLLLFLQVMSVIEGQGIATTSEIQMRLGLVQPLLKTDVGPVSADSEGYLIDTLDAKYQATVRATSESASQSITTEVEVRAACICTSTGSGVRRGGGPRQVLR